MHVAGTREPRRSGNPFLDDDEEEERHSSSVIAVPDLALPASTMPPPNASQPSSHSLRSPQAIPPPVSSSATGPTDSQAPTQQAVGPAPVEVKQHSDFAPSAISSSRASPGSPVGMDRQASRQHSGQVQDRAGQVSSRAGPVSGPMQQSRSGHMPTPPHPLDPHVDQRPPENHPQEPALSPGPAGLSNNSAAAAAGASTSAWQQSSIDSGVSQQANVPADEPGATQPVPASAQLHQAQTGAVQEAQVLQAAGQGSQAAPHSLQRLESGQHQQESIRPGAGIETPSMPPSQETMVPSVHMQAALSQTQPGVSTSAQAPVNRGSAGPALPLQQRQGSFPRAPPPTADMQVYEPPPMGNPPPRQGGQQGGSALQEQQATGLEGMLGRSAPDSDKEEEESAASSQDRQRFMQSLQSPDQGASRSRNLAKGFGRMRAKAKDMLQAKNAGSPPGPSTRSAQQAPQQGVAGRTAPTPTDAEPGKRGRLARDMTMMFAGLKKPINQQ